MARVLAVLSILIVLTPSFTSHAVDYCIPAGDDLLRCAFCYHKIQIDGVTCTAWEGWCSDGWYDTGWYC